MPPSMSAYLLQQRVVVEPQVRCYKQRWRILINVSFWFDLKLGYCLIIARFDVQVPYDDGIAVGKNPFACICSIGSSAKKIRI